MIIDLNKLFNVIGGVILAIIMYKIIRKDVLVIETNISEKCKK